MAIATDRIGQWCRRRRVDRVNQRDTWHLVESEIEDSVITRCGRQMKLAVEWQYRGWTRDTHRLEFMTDRPKNSYLFDQIICKMCYR